MPIEGLDNLVVRLEKMGEGDMRQALETACKLVEITAKGVCPVDDGQLRQSITHEVIGNVGVVGTNVEYAPYVHQGTGIHAINEDGRKTPWKYKDAKGEWHTTEGQRPKPFLQQAINHNRFKIKQLFREAMRND